MKKDSRAEQLLRDLHYYGVYIAPDVANRMINKGWVKNAAPDEVIVQPATIQVNTLQIPQRAVPQNIFHRYNR